jgi:tRNA A58 N-methylase Trm61
MLKGHLKGAGKCLDVGYGSGYMTVAMRLLMKDMKNGVVFGIDHVRSFLPQAEDNLIRFGHRDIKCWLRGMVARVQGGFHDRRRS